MSSTMPEAVPRDARQVRRSLSLERERTLSLARALSLFLSLARSLSDVSHQILLQALLTNAPNSCPPNLT